ncbi:hypothetical protein O3P69_014111 [Scylla paramamosain]|uniref:Uncharacterized protein n=1 Tax=Scylla paramamosain TaxID=85552 RepID=A0AAW0SRB8_SCYPA
MPGSKMSPSLQQVFLALISWCVWKKSFIEGRDLPFLAEEYLGRLDACRCVPITHPCSDEFVAIPFLTVYSQPLKVCAQGTRLCCQETASPKTTTFKTAENLNYLLVKVPPGVHRGHLHHLPGYLSGLSRRLAPTQKDEEAGDGDGGDGNVTQQEVGDGTERDAGGSLLERTEGAITTENINIASSFIPGDVTVTEWNETEWTKRDELYTKGMEKSTLNPDASTITYAPELNTRGGMNVLTWIYSLSEPPSVSIECLTGVCHENSSPSTVDVDAAVNVSVGVKDTKTPKQTETVFPTDNITLDPVTQGRTNASSPTQDQTPTPSHKLKQVITLSRTESMFPSENITTQHPGTQDQSTVTSSPTQDQRTESYKQGQEITPRHNESMSLSENVTTDLLAAQDQTITSTQEQTTVLPHMQEADMRSNASILIARVNEPVPFSGNGTTMEMDNPASTSPSQAHSPITTPKPDTTTTTASTTTVSTSTRRPPTTTTTTASPGLWEWLFG